MQSLKEKVQRNSAGGVNSISSKDTPGMFNCN